MNRCVLNGNVIRDVEGFRKICRTFFYKNGKLNELCDYTYDTKLSYIYETNEVVIEPYHKENLNDEMIMKALRCLDRKIRNELKR